MPWTLLTNGCESTASSSEHPVGVHRLGGDGLADIPQLGDAIVLEAEEMNERDAAVIGLVLNSRVHRNEISVLQDVQHIQPLPRILAGVLLHACHQCLGISCEERIV